MDKNIQRTLKVWARRFYWMLRPKQVWRYIVYWGFSIPSRLNTQEESETKMWASCLRQGTHVSHQLLDLQAGEALLRADHYPLISCMMVTRERFLLARQAIQCFMHQTYPNKELVIVDDEKDSQLKAWVLALNDAKIKYVHLPDEKKSLGFLRNLAVQTATGDYVAQWDDDDISHPQRLAWQMTAMFTADTQVSFLHRQMLWFPEKMFLGISHHFLAENTILCKKDLLPSYPELRKGEDTPVCHELVEKYKVLLCDRPLAYMYTFQSSNTWDQKHFERLAEQCSHQYRNDAYNKKLLELSKSYATSLSSGLVSQRINTTQAAGSLATLPNNDIPSLLVLVPVKNAADNIQQFVNNLAETDYPAEKISLAFLEGDSSDDSYAQLEALLPALRQRYARVELYQKNFRYQLTQGQERWAVSEQRQRRAVIAKSRNTLLSHALQNEEWVMWIDVDVASWPKDVFIRLLQSGKDIVVPHCVKEDGSTFDLNTFKLSEDAETLDWQRYVVDGILQPPVGYGRQYLGEFSKDSFVELDGVGGTMLLVRANLHREGLNFPVQPHRYYIETEGLAQIAKDMGYQSWGMPSIEIVHYA